MSWIRRALIRWGWTSLATTDNPASIFGSGH